MEGRTLIEAVLTDPSIEYTPFEDDMAVRGIKCTNFLSAFTLCNGGLWVIVVYLRDAAFVFLLKPRFTDLLCVLIPASICQELFPYSLPRPLTPPPPPQPLVD